MNKNLRRNLGLLVLCICVSVLAASAQTEERELTDKEKAIVGEFETNPKVFAYLTLDNMISNLGDDPTSDSLANVLVHYRAFAKHMLVSQKRNPGEKMAELLRLGVFDGETYMAPEAQFSDRLAGAARTKNAITKAIESSRLAPVLTREAALMTPTPTPVATKVVEQTPTPTPTPTE